MDLCHTFYVTTQQSDYSGPDDTQIYDPQGNVIATVPAAFVADLCVEGAGILNDGRVVNVAGVCQYGPACLTGSPMCYTVIDSGRYPWGIGAHSRPLVPFRSIATDPSVIPTGSCVYVPSWDGLQVPQVGNLGGFAHDGYFVADDVGGYINGNHVDIFVGTRAMERAMDAMVPTSYRGAAHGTCASTFAANVVDCSQVPATIGSGGAPAASSVAMASLWVIGFAALGAAAYFVYREYERGALPEWMHRRV